MMRLMLLLGLLTLAACSRSAPDVRGQITRAQLDTVQQPLLFAELDSLGTAASLVQGGRNGAVVTWLTADRVGLSFHDGLLVATRGLGQDLISADVSGTRRALAGGAGRYHARLYSYLDGEHQTQYRAFKCLITDRRPETIDIFDHVHATTRVEETCYSTDLEVVNRYWTGGGVMWKSQQWVSPFAGYLLTERLVR